MSRAAAKKIRLKDFPNINSDVYSMIALNHLVVYAVHFLQEHGVTAKVEEIVSVCFRMFPKSFALKNYPRWPDSALVIRRLNDGREKGNIKGNSLDGFALKYKGQLVAKRVAKALGLDQAISAKSKIKVKKIAVASQKKKAVEPISRKRMPERQVSKPSSAVIVKQETLPLIKMEEKPHKRPVKLTVPSPVKEAPIKKKPIKQSGVKAAESSQLTMAFLPSPKKEARVSKKKDVPPAAASPVSKEEKVKASKFIHVMERSDAYLHYKKNGRNAKIGEFDFRSLLLCTMESSRETLVKNIKLFKGYASVHNRQDLITFLSHCEDRFSYLLTPPKKHLKKRSGEREYHG